MSTYDAKFFDYVNDGALRSASLIIPLLKEVFNVESVLDVGCGQGAWLSVWNNNGTSELMGLDGDYVDTNRLLISRSEFSAKNLENKFELDRSFDLVQSLEVAEHLPESSANGFVESLVKHSSIIMFSAASKGQGGHHHINEQDYNYWKRKFEEKNYVAFDYIRPKIIDNKDIEVWYRYNIFLYVSKDLADKLPDVVKNSIVGQNCTLSDLSPPIYKLRKRIIRLLPNMVQTYLAHLKEKITMLIKK